MTTNLSFKSWSDIFPDAAYDPAAGRLRPTGIPSRLRQTLCSRAEVSIAEFTRRVSARIRRGSHVRHAGGSDEGLGHGCVAGSTL